MAYSGADWVTHQLAAFLGAITGAEDEPAATGAAVERAAEVLEAEVGALVRDGAVLAAVGFGAGRRPDSELVALSKHLGGRQHPVSWTGTACVATVSVDDDEDSRLMLVRAGDDPFATEEIGLLRAFARALHQSLRTLRLLDEERQLREASESLAAERARLVTELTERRDLLERLSRIQRSISHRMPLDETLDAIASGAAALIGDDVVGIRLIDPDDPTHYYLAAQYGMSEQMARAIHRGPIGQGAGGRAISEQRLVIIRDYQSAENVVPELAADQLTSAMAAPVHDNGKVCGSLVVASHAPNRYYSAAEQDALLAFAEHATLAISDARNHAAMLEAQHAKEMFLAMVSHELKTPLTVIMGSLDTLRRHHDSLDVDMREDLFLAAVDRGRQLERLIDSLLRGARAELAGEQSFVDLNELIRSAVAGFGHLREVVVDGVSSTQILVDASAVRDVIGILLENAVAHSPERSAIHVTCELGDDQLTIGIANVGALPPDVDPTKLFLPFQRGADARSSGVGLGLFIAARLAESLRGLLEVGPGDRPEQIRFTLRCPVGAAVTPESPRTLAGC